MMVLVQKSIVQLLILSLMAAAPLMPAQAAIVGTDTAIAMSERADALARINEVLLRENVGGKLEALGVDRELAMERVAALTPAELSQLQTQIDQLPAGGNALEVLGVILIVLVILDLIGLTNVFTFI
ncbi:MAG: PA2779 family protein [Pseudomonadales bacterium]